MNIVLIGMPGTGKSTTGVILAKKLGMDFIDTDILFKSKVGKTVPQIISERGIDGFLEAEGEIGESIDCDNTVIATGGSMVLSAQAMTNLSRGGVIVWLDTDVAELTKRIEADLKQRGVAAADGMTVSDIFAERKPYYEKYADFRISCHGSIAQTVNELMAIAAKFT